MSSRPLTFAEALRDALAVALRADPSVFLLGEDLGFDSLLQVRLIDRLRTKYPQLENAPVDELVFVIKSIDDLVQYVTHHITGKETPV